MVKIGFEVYAEGPTRVLRICEFSDSHKEDIVLHSCIKIQLRVSQAAIHFLECEKQVSLSYFMHWLLEDFHMFIFKKLHEKMWN